MKEKNAKRMKEKGITLIALVVTIVVLLILAGVSITVLFGDSGIITMAQKAADETNKAAEKDQDDLDELNKYLTSGNWGNAPEEPIEPPIIPKEDETLQPTPENKGKILIGSNKEYNDGEKNAMIPVGFCVVKDIEGDINNITNGLVISDVANDDLNNSKEGNQFVWIPVEDFSKFVRIEGFENGERQSMLSRCKEPGKEGDAITTVESIAMYQSVKDNRGFYIARFEAGIQGIKEPIIEASKAPSIEGELPKPISKKGVAPWNCIPWNAETTEQASATEKIAKSMYKKSNICGVTSTLCYGVQWDAAMQFIETQYINVPEEGQEEPVPSDSFVRNSEGKGNHNGLKITGQYEQKHIYDLAGNLYELSMETQNPTYFVTRGTGWIQIMGADVAASGRILFGLDDMEDIGNIIRF